MIELLRNYQTGNGRYTQNAGNVQLDFEYASSYGLKGLVLKNDASRGGHCGWHILCRTQKQADLFKAWVLKGKPASTPQKIAKMKKIYEQEQKLKAKRALDVSQNVLEKKRYESISDCGGILVYSANLLQNDFGLTESVQSSRRFVLRNGFGDGSHSVTIIRVNDFEKPATNHYVFGDQLPKFNKISNDGLDIWLCDTDMSVSPDISLLGEVWVAIQNSRIYFLWN